MFNIFVQNKYNNMLDDIIICNYNINMLKTIILFVIAFKGLNAAPLEIFMAFVITTASHGLAMFHYGTKE